MITEQVLSLSDMERIIQQQQKCTQCSALLTLAWGGAFGHECYVLRCGRDASHEGIERPYVPSPYALPDEVTRFNLSRGRKERLMKEHGEEKTQALMKYAGVGSLTREEATFILNTCWPEAAKSPLGQVEITKAATICQMYGLNPLLKHLHLVAYNKGKPNETWTIQVGIQATRFKAHEKGDFSYMDNTPRVMTAQEQELTFGEVDGKNLWVITKLRDTKGNMAPGYGYWSKETEVYGKEKGNSRFNMAAIRSERQAIDRLFGGTLPQSLEIMDERYVESPYQLVDQETGEITSPEAPEGTSPGNPPAPGPQGPPAATVEGAAGDVGGTKTLEELFGEPTSAEPQPKTKLKNVLSQEKAEAGEIKYLRNLALRKGQSISEEELARLSPEEASKKIAEWGQLKDKGK